MYHPLINLILSTVLVSVNFVDSAQLVVYDDIEHQKQEAISSEILNSKEVTFLEELNGQYLTKIGLPINDNIIAYKKLDMEEEFDLSGISGIVIDVKTKDILFSKEADKQLPVASITKLMTALVFLDTEPDLNNLYQIKTEDRRVGGRIYIYTGEKIKIKDLLYLSLTASANTATISLVNSTGLSQDEFISRMNRKAADLGLKNTFFYDPTGLDDFNVSTAREIAKLANVAFSNKIIGNAILNESYSFRTLNGRSVTAYSTNALLHSSSNRIKVLGGKTGHINVSGYCFVGKFNDIEGHDLISVVLGAENVNDRFTETMKMIKWVYKNYEWK